MIRGPLEESRCGRHHWPCGILWRRSRSLHVCHLDLGIALPGDGLPQALEISISPLQADKLLLEHCHAPEGSLDHLANSLLRQIGISDCFPLRWHSGILACRVVGVAMAFLDVFEPGPTRSGCSGLRAKSNVCTLLNGQLQLDQVSE